MYHICKTAALALRVLLTRSRVVGGENVPRQGALVVVANHLNLADPPLLALALGRKAIFMAKEELYRSPLARYLLPRLGSFPVRRGQLDLRAMRDAEAVLAAGEVLVVFPEGGRSQSGELQPAFAGAALIARRSGVPILPAAICGTERLKGRMCWLRRHRITIRFGTPFRLPAAKGKVPRSELAHHTENLMERIAELLPPQYRGGYDTEKADGAAD